jgi:hypothetical protein
VYGTLGSLASGKRRTEKFCYFIFFDIVASL